MAKTRVKQIVIGVISVLGLTLTMGQGCSRPESQSGTSPAFSAARGNGGGYGGMQSNNNGTYSNPPSVNGTARATPHYLLIGTESGCRAYIAGWESVGPDVIGVISLGGLGMFPQYSPSLCANAMKSSAMGYKTADFDLDVAIFREQIFRHYENMPPAVTDLKTPVAFCRFVAQTPNRLDIGTDVSINEMNGQLYGEIAEGKVIDAGGLPSQFSVPPFAVTQALSADQVIYSTYSFTLTVARNGNRATSGTLAVLLDGQQESLAMSCWLTTP